MSDHTSISPQLPTTAPATAKDVMPVQEQLQNELDILHLQKKTIQFKLTIGTADDPLEHEADAMADTIMRMPEQNFIKRKCAGCEEEEKLQRKPLASFIQRKVSSSGAVASDALSTQINTSKGNGSSMDSSTQSFMQSRFGADFSDVKIHTGGEAMQMNRELNAKAFTVGNDIYFNEGQYNPGSNEGKYLLAHELTHTVQQNKNISTKKILRQVDPEIATLPATNYLDIFTNSYYDFDYRSVGGNLSTWAVLEYSDGTIIDFNLYDLREETNPAYNPVESMSHGHVGPGNRIFPRDLNSKTLPNLWRVCQEAIRRMEEFNYEFILAALPAVIFIITISGTIPVSRPTPRASVTSRIRERIRLGYRTPPGTGATAAFNARTVADELYSSVAGVTGNGQKMLAAGRQLSAMSNLSAMQKVEVILAFFNRIGFATRGAYTETATYFQLIAEDGRYMFQFMKDSGVIRYGRFNLETGQWMWMTL